MKQSGDVYEVAEHCTEGWSEISHGSLGNGYLKVETSTTRDASPPLWPVDCITTKNMPAQYIQVQPEVWQDGSPYDLKCADWGTLYTSVSTWRLLFERHFADVPESGGCGGRSDYYGTYGGHFARFNGSWVGDYLFSGWHWLPTTPTREIVAEFGVEGPPAPKLPEWVDPHTMRVDQSLLPEAMAAAFATVEMADGQERLADSGMPAPGVFHEGGDLGMVITRTIENGVEVVR